MATLTKTRGRKPLTVGTMSMSRFRGSILDVEAGTKCGFRLLLPLASGRDTGFYSLNMTDEEAARFVSFYNEQTSKDRPAV